MKKISTKINISILTVTLLILAFVGSVTIINLNIDYRRSFEKTADSIMSGAELQSADSVESICAYLDKSMPLLSESCEYYILVGGNIVKSSKSGGLIEMTDKLSKELGITDGDFSNSAVHTVTSDFTLHDEISFNIY